MLTVLVTNTKGGCGKTTLSTNLAAAFAGAGLVTALADCDRQRSALGWVARRPADRPRVRGLDWVDDIARPPRALDRLVIDAPAGLKHKTLDALVKEADVVVLPVLPSFFDEQTTRGFLLVLDELKPVRKGRRSVAVVGNRVRPRTGAAARLDRFLAGVGHPVVARLRDSQAYVTAAEGGIGVLELAGSRYRPLGGDWEPLLAFINALGATAGE